MNGNGRRESNALQIDVDDDYVSNYSNIQVVSSIFFIFLMINRKLKGFHAYLEAQCQIGLKN